MMMIIIAMTVVKEVPDNRGLLAHKDPKVFKVPQVHEDVEDIPDTPDTLDTLDLLVIQDLKEK
jgi:hypothetical protein